MTNVVQASGEVGARDRDDVVGERYQLCRLGLDGRAVQDRVRHKVRRVDPSAFTKTSALGVDEQRVNVILDLDGPVEGWQSIGDGFAAEVEITVWSKPDALQVPTSALFRQGDGWAVFAVKGGLAKASTVQVGHRGALNSEIVAGLESGQAVVIHPSVSVRDGVPVQHR